MEAQCNVYALSGIDYTVGVQTGYLIVKGAEALLVDASADVAVVKEVLALHNASLSAILLTHCHFDHCANAARLQTAFPAAPLYASPQTAQLLLDGSWLGTQVGYPVPQWQPDVAVQEGEMRVGSFDVRVIYTPGHTADSVCYLIDNAFLAAGDTVMNDLICGRTDLPTGNAAVLAASARKLWPLVPDEARILGGHVSRQGEEWEEYFPRSTVGRAKTRNMINRL